MPDKAREHTDAGAMAMAGWYLQAGDYAYVTNDESTIKSWAEASCAGCNQGIQGVLANAKAGYRQSDTAVTSVDTRLVTRESADSIVVGVVTVRRSVNILDKDGKVATTQPAGSTPWLVRAIWGGSGWRIDEVSRQEVKK